MKKVSEFLSKILFSEKWTCNLCGREVFDGYFCQDCLSKLPFNDGEICFHCGRHVKVSENYCLTCKGKLTAIDKGRSVFRYKDEVAFLIRKLKYDNGRYLAKVFAPYLEKLYLKNYFNADFMVFVPMTDNALKERGYNQTELLANELTKLINVPIKNVIVKVKETERQATLDRGERIKNLNGAFKVVDQKTIENKTVLIIDDVTTTGSTGEVIASLLKKKGASKVFLLTVASVGEEEQDKE